MKIYNGLDEVYQAFYNDKKLRFYGHGDSYHGRTANIDVYTYHDGKHKKIIYLWADLTKDCVFAYLEDGSETYYYLDIFQLKYYSFIEYALPLNKIGIKAPPDPEPKVFTEEFTIMPPEFEKDES